MTVKQDTDRGYTETVMPPKRTTGRMIYPSPKGGKPLNFGMNYAKRVARVADRRDQRTVQQKLGFGLPRQHSHHQELVRQRHAYYTGEGA